MSKTKLRDLVEGQAMSLAEVRDLKPGDRVFSYPQCKTPEVLHRLREAIFATEPH